MLNPTGAPTFNLPSFSVASVSKGMWYVFEDGPNQIRAWGSSWLGLERVYFNQTIVQHWSHLKRKEQYHFSVNGDEYRIECFTKNYEKWQVECILWKNNVKIDGLRCRRKKIVNIRPTLAHLYAGITAGIIGGLFNLPFWYGIVFIFFSMSLTLITTAKTGTFIFEKAKSSLPP